MASPEREPEQHRDPFENLRLDEGFVRAARFIEPSAAERGRSADRRDPGRCQVVPANRRLPAGMHRMVWPPRPGRRRRRAARIVAFLAVLAGVLSIVIALRHSNNRATPPLASPQGGTGTSPAATSPVAPRHAGGVLVAPALLSTLQAGECVNWDPAKADGARDAAVVPCAQPHRAEVVKLVELGWQIPGTGWPGISSLDTLAASQCAAAFNSYTSQSQAGIEPVSGALEPSPDAWANGVKRLACTVQRAQLAPITGPVGTAATPA